jgi:hypothetical protein
MTASVSSDETVGGLPVSLEAICIMGLCMDFVAKDYCISKKIALTVQVHLKLESSQYRTYVRVLL